MALLFRLIRFVLPFLMMYLFFQVLRNFLYYARSAGYSSRSEYSGRTEEAGSERQKASYRRRDPYSVLECSPNASDEQVRSCYRRMVTRYHPDRFIGQDLDQEFIDLATEKFKEVQNAYDQIKKMRGMA